MGILDEILRSYAWPLATFFGGITALIISILTFREQFVRLLAMLPQPLVDLFSRITVFRVAIGQLKFETEFGQRVKKAKDRAKGIEDTVAASRAMPAPNRLGDAGTQSTRDLVLAAWGALQQIVYDASSASNLPLTPATRIPEAVRRLAEVHAIDSDLASLIDVLYNLGHELADDIGLRPLEDDAKIYRELADLVVDWMMINILSRRKDEAAKPREEPKPRAKTMVGGHFPAAQIGFPVTVLVGIGGPVRGQRFAVEKAYFRIGSNADNDLRITGDAYVSGHHAALRYEQGSLFLADQGSRNGSFVNDRRVAGTPVVVRQGDHLRLGESVFQVAEELNGVRPTEKASTEVR
jgi:pSer/pThr/pTyr-binding forkhead associated (FHA) protein